AIETLLLLDLSNAGLSRVHQPLDVIPFTSVSTDTLTFRKRTVVYQWSSKGRLPSLVHLVQEVRHFCASIAKAAQQCQRQNGWKEPKELEREGKVKERE